MKQLLLIIGLQTWTTFAYDVSDPMNVDMSDDHRDALRKLKGNLHFLDPQPVIEHLYSHNALSFEEAEGIKAKATKTEQSTAMLETLEQNNDFVYYCLLDGLYRSRQEYVVDILHGGILLDKKI